MSATYKGWFKDSNGAWHWRRMRLTVRRNTEKCWGWLVERDGVVQSDGHRDHKTAIDHALESVYGPRTHVVQCSRAGCTRARKPHRPWCSAHTRAQEQRAYAARGERA